MNSTSRLTLVFGLLFEALLFAGVAYAQTPPVPTPAPQPQTLVGRELAAAGQIITDASNNVNAIVLLVIAVCVVFVILGIVMIVVLRAILDAQKRADQRQAQRDQIELEEKLRREKAEGERVGAFTQSVNTFAVVTAGIARLETDVALLKEDKTDSKRQTLERDAKYYERIQAAENRIVGSLENFGERMAQEIGIALTEGQKQAGELIVKALPGLIEQFRQQPLVVVTDDPARVKTGKTGPLISDEAAGKTGVNIEVNQSNEGDTNVQQP